MAKGKGVGSSKGLNPRTRGGSAGRLVWLEDEITPNLARIEPYVNDVVATVFRYNEGRVEAHARTNAPWTDRTANARNGLIAQSGRQGGTHFLILAHRVSYGIWLEVRFGGKYAIIMPTLDLYAPQIMDQIEGILDKFGGRAGLSR